jgi:methionyl-tRNA formyltransferase
MKISFLCSSKEHPVFPLLSDWQSKHSTEHAVEIVDSKDLLQGGDILFLISCNEMLDSKTRSMYQFTLVMHASAVPKGRGWSPHIWQILEGKNRIVVSLLEADNTVDSGRIWFQKEMVLDGHELFDEINEVLFSIELELIDFAIDNFFTIKPQPQNNLEPSYYPKRTPADSRIDPNKTIAEQFNLLRVADPNRFPAFFELSGHRYKINLVKIKDEGDER